MKILIVDDHPGMARSIGRSLRRLGHEPIVADGAMEALRLVDEGVDAVITDVMLPSMGGADLARLIRRRAPGLPVIFYTVHDALEDVVQHARQFGTVISKTSTRDQLEDLFSSLEPLRQAA